MLFRPKGNVPFDPILFNAKLQRCCFIPMYTVSIFSWKRLGLCNKSVAPQRVFVPL